MRPDPVDSAARSHAIDTLGSVLVQAPAGSGKTTLLAQRYLRLLATVDGPERILALTFTRRAAVEMRERVLQALKAAALPQCPSQLHPGTWELGVRAARKLHERGLDLERHPSRLRIETIDAFNAWLAGQLPVTAGAGSRLALADQPRALYEEAARRALMHEEPDAFGAAVERVLTQGDLRWPMLVDLIADMLPSRDRWLPLLAGHLRAGVLDETQLDAVRRRFDEDLELLVLRVLRKAAGAIGSERLAALTALMHAAACRVEIPDAGHDAWRADPSLLRADAGDIERWRGVAAMMLTDKSTYRRRLTKDEGYPPQCADKSLMLDLIVEFGRQPEVLHILCEIRKLPKPRYDDGQWGRVREVAQVLILAAAQLDQCFRERGLVDFPAVSMAAARALGTAEAPTDLALRLDYRLQHILVDEFQDTSSAQLELLKLLTAGWQRGDGRTVFCVGDPMQSIYGFREAEVRAFLELAEEGIGEVHFDVVRLRSNFRSEEAIVAWINRCFARILPQSDDRERGAIAFRPSEAALRGAEQAAGAVRLLGFASSGDEARAVADLVGEELGRHPSWRVAILVRAKSHARDIAACLRSRGISFRAVDIEPLRDAPVVRDLVTLLAALLHFGDRSAWLAVLRAPWSGLKLEDLLEIARSGGMVWHSLCDEAVISRLTPDGQVRSNRVRATLEAAFRVRGHSSIARWLEKTWLALGGANCATAPELEHAGRVLTRVRELEEQGLPDAADLPASFDDLFAEYAGTSPVEIMTIHKAKGLEFDLVVVPALDRQIPMHQDELLLSHQFARAARDGMVMAARPGVGEESDELFEFLRAQARDASALESERLLYVACTRAKRQLMLTATRANSKPRAGSLLAVLWPVIGDEFEPPVAPAGEMAPGGEMAQAIPRGGPLLRVPAGWSPATDRQLHGDGHFPAAAAPPRVETPVFDWAGETARRVGSLVHAQLQSLDLAATGPASIRAREPDFRRWLALQGVPAERLREAAGRAVEALVAVYGDPRARWILSHGYRDDFREYAISGLWEGGLVHAVFDRSFIDADDVRWVIDYKTSQHAGGRLEEFLDREVERYRPQLQRYAGLARQLGPEPVRVGLYFPLMRAWREWTP